MDTVTCLCKECNLQVGKYLNLWVRIGKSHYAPVNGVTDLGSLQIHENIRHGTRQTILAGSFLQSLSCKECSTILGIRCENAPEGHVLKKDQLILRLGGLSMVSDITGKIVSPKVQDRLSLQREPRANSFEIAGTSQVRDHEENQLAETFLSNPGDSEPASHFREWIEAVKVQGQDIDRISGAVARIDKDMQKFKDFISTIRTEIASRPKTAELAQLGQGISALTGGLEDLRQDFERKLNDDRLRIGVDEIDVLTGSISTLGQKVNEVDSLKMEIQFLKARLKHLEETSRKIIPSTEPKATITPGRGQTESNASPLVQVAHQAVLHLETAIESPLSATAAKRKRNSVQVDETISEPKRGRLTETPTNTIISRTAPQPSKLKQMTYLYNTADDSDIDDLCCTTNFKPLSASAEPPTTTAEPPNTYRPPILPSPRPTTTTTPSPTRHTERTTLPSRRHSSNMKPTSSAQTSSSPPAIKPAIISRRKSRRATVGLRRRRAPSETLRNEDGVRLTKKGLPDKRHGNYKYLRAYYQRLKKGGEAEEGDTDMESMNEVEVEVDGDADGEEEETVEELNRKRAAAVQAREREVVEALKMMERDELDS